MKNRSDEEYTIELVGIGEAAKHSKLSIQQLRYLERIHMITPSRIKMGAREDRLFDREQVDLLKRIKSELDTHHCPISKALEFVTRNEGRK